MKVFRLVPNSNSYSCLETRSKDWPALDQFRGVPLSAAWKPLKLRHDDTVGKRGDFPSLRGPIPALSTRAWAALSGLLERSVESLPVHADGETLYLLNVLDVRECLDHSRSKFKRYESSERIMYVRSYSFVESAIEGAIMWKVPETVGLEVLVSEEFKKHVDDNKLLGLEFEKVPQI